MKMVFALLLVSTLVFPAFAQENSQVLPTEKGTLLVDLSTIPENPQPGETVKLKINFLNPTTSKIQEHIDYSVKVSKDEIDHFGPTPLIHTSEGSVTIPVDFKEKGEYSTTITVEGILFQPIPREQVNFLISVGEASAQPNTPTPKSDNGGCLIATAAYGTELAPQVQQLRELRDNKLLATESGSSFMKGFNEFYYSFSPSIADMERQSPVFKEAVKLAITPMISTLSILNYVDMDSEASVIGYGIAIISLNIGMYAGIPTAAILRLYRVSKK